MGPNPNDMMMYKTHDSCKTDLTYKYEYVWRSVIFISYAHLGAFYSLYLLTTRAMGIELILFEFVYGYMSLFGITAGVHRLWSHRAYKAKLPLRVILMIFQTMNFQRGIYEWSRDHRVHHKFTETDADPYNAKRGFFFSHIGWLLVKKYPDVFIKGKTVDMSDLEKDPVVVWQRKYYSVVMPLLAFILPTLIPIYGWGVDPWTAWYATLFRWTIFLNITSCVNSFAHLWGTRPYDKEINPSENSIAIALTTGEGFHNYHHTFSYDYKAAELRNPIFNSTTTLIDFFAKIGWAYDLKVASEETIRRRTLRSGDGSHTKYNGQHHDVDDNDQTEYKVIWGGGDKDM